MITEPTEAMLKAARGWADGAEANRLRRNPGPTPHEEACFAAGMARALSLIEAYLRKKAGPHPSRTEFHDACDALVRGDWLAEESDDA